jgi:DNA-binding beta-propeller fold protein YncE
MRHRKQQSVLRGKLAALIFIALLLAGCSTAGSVTSTETTHIHDDSHEHPEQATDVAMPHIHGLGFAPDGRQLLVPAHDGLRIYRAGKWLVPDVPTHDYMGFTVANDGFYSSGHPDPATNLVNPLGLVKSTDSGQTLVKLGFEGESDFHFMAVGYENHAIYVANPAPNSTLQAGVYYSLDSGQRWQPSALQGLTAQPTQMAVHPTDAAVVVMATGAGLFLSNDYANSFAPIEGSGAVTAVTFHPNGQTLLLGYQQLSTYNLAAQQLTTLSSPALDKDDVINYLAMNPLNPDEIAVATFNRDIHWSADGGKSWIKIAEDGQAQ